MRTWNKRLRRAISSVAGALILVLAVVAPVIEAGDFAHSVAVESDHGCHGPSPHEHWIHAQLGANPGLPSVSRTESHLAVASPMGREPVSNSATQAATPGLPEARAPPLG